jgi:uncharacterized protein YfaS (alpha-2-macroglobulin family)
MSNTLSLGEEIEVKLNLFADDDYEHIIVEDPLPSGCEVMREQSEYYYWEYWYSRKEIRDTKMVFFATDLKKGKNEITYVMRAEIPGEYHILPARAYGMYIPEIWGTSGKKP